MIISELVNVRLTIDDSHERIWMRVQGFSFRSVTHFRTEFAIADEDIVVDSAVKNRFLLLDLYPGKNLRTRAKFKSRK